MKNKKLIYFLMPMVLLVWGLIFYRVYMGLENNDKESYGQLSYNSGKKEDVKQDTFVLIASYKDPFLDGKTEVARVVSSGQVLEKRAIVQSSMPLVIPDIQYYGLISNAKNKGKIGLIKFQGKDCFLREGDVSDLRLKVIRLLKDSVVLIYQQQKVTIKRI
ncbi:MAG TPA: hypothetical protein VHO90_13840 [Bacteroidales bacterium]|nr:hypothetical protein [Bacteroidales bacterium]